MADKRNRVPWWLVASSALFVVLAAVFGFIATVGRPGFAGLPTHIKKGMSRAEVVRILGTADEAKFGEALVWDQGLARLAVWFDDHNRVYDAVYFLGDPGPGWHLEWRVRRWAQEAYATIHGVRH